MRRGLFLPDAGHERDHLGIEAGTRVRDQDPPATGVELPRNICAERGRAADRQEDLCERAQRRRPVEWLPRVRYCLASLAAPDAARAPPLPPGRSACARTLCQLRRTVVR